MARIPALPSALVVAITSPLLSELRENAKVGPANTNDDTLPSATTGSTAPLATATRNNGCWPMSEAVV